MRAVAQDFLEGRTRRVRPANGDAAEGATMEGGDRRGESWRPVSRESSKGQSTATENIIYSK